MKDTIELGQFDICLQCSASKDHGTYDVEKIHKYAVSLLESPARTDVFLHIIIVNGFDLASGAKIKFNAKFGWQQASHVWNSSPEYKKSLLDAITSYMLYLSPEEERKLFDPSEWRES